MLLGQGMAYVAQYSAQEKALHYLKERISGGIFPAGSVLPTERQLAVDIGVSRPIVRDALQILQEHGWIDRLPGHRPRVAARLPRGTMVGPLGSGPAAEPARATLAAVAAVMPMEPTYPAAYNVLRGIQRTLHREESALRLIFFDSLTAATPRGNHAAAEGERQSLETVLADGIAGVVLWHQGGEQTLDVLMALRRAGVPVVFIDRYPRLPGAPTCDYVGVDNRRGAREAVEFLIGLGHRRIAHLTHRGRGYEDVALSVQERYDGYCDALWEHGIPLDHGLIYGNAAELIDRLKSRGGSNGSSNGGADVDVPTAVFSVNDTLAHRFIDALQENGLRVPGDVSVIGFDDLDRYSYRSSHLTTMYLPFEEVGERASELLLRRLRTPRQPDEPVLHILLSTTLVVRGTCERIGPADPGIVAGPLSGIVTSPGEPRSRTVF